MTLTIPSDPFATPTSLETPQQRTERLKKEAEAKRISDAIDAELDRERKTRRPVQILLLGQSESGKSTTLKNFQLIHDPKSFARERISWRAIIQLNVIRSFHVILDAMERAERNIPTEDDDNFQENLPKLSIEHSNIKRRLSSLLELERILIQQLSPIDSGENEAIMLPEQSSFVCSLREVTVNSAAHWKNCFAKLVKNERQDETTVDWENPADPGRVLNACSEDMISLWNDSIIQDLLKKLKVRLRDQAGFFLDSLERVTAVRYLPTDDDILRARIKTLGVSEHCFRLNQSTDVGKDWHIYDVGGHRSQRAAWVPYFDAMDAIIFLAPISAFDQVLEEDRNVNRLLDSFQLWTFIVSNELLCHTNLILFLNKIDIFSEKIAAGVRFADFVTSYRDRPNDYESIKNYTRRKFASLMKKHSKIPRLFYSYFTTATDPKSTQTVLVSLQDMIMQQNFSHLQLT